MAARYEAMEFARFPGMQPFGNYAIHIIVRNGRTTLMGIVDNEGDKTIAGVRAREVPQVFSVENELMVSK
jgi:osmotically-inducible protein OsmY